MAPKTTKITANTEIRSDYLIDRLELREQLNKWRLVAVIAFAMMVISLAGNNQTVELKDFVARLSLEGEIFDNKKRLDKINRLAENPRVKAVILHVNSPGGEVTASEKLYLAVKNLNKKKPVICLFGSVAASGAYMAALGCDYIIAHQSSVTGSIGALAETHNFHELANKLGIKSHIVRSGKNKYSPAPSEPFDPEKYALYQQLVEDIGNLFKNLVLKHRDIPAEKHSEVFDGRIFLSTKALEAGLIDFIGSEQDVLNLLKEEYEIDLSVQNIELHEKKMVDKILDDLSSKVLSYFTRSSTPLAINLSN